MTSTPTERQEAIEAVRSAREGIFEGEDLTVEQLERLDQAREKAEAIGVTDRDIGPWPQTIEREHDTHGRDDPGLEAEQDRGLGLGYGYDLER